MLAYERSLSAALIICSAGVNAAESSLDKEKIAQDVSALFAAKAVDNTTPGCVVTLARYLLFGANTL